MRNFATADGGGLLIHSGTPMIASDTKFTKNIPNDFASP